jgi:hypothetical protein
MVLDEQHKSDCQPHELRGLQRPDSTVEVQEAKEDDWVERSSNEEVSLETGYPLVSEVDIGVVAADRPKNPHHCQTLLPVDVVLVLRYH